jgi:putative FmdB family regulatory protein
MGQPGCRLTIVVFEPCRTAGKVLTRFFKPPPGFRRNPGFLPKRTRLWDVSEYECKQCGHEFSAFLSLDERKKKKVRCPKCDSTDVKHVIESVFVTTSKKS